MPSVNFTDVGVSYRAFPATSRPWRVELVAGFPRGRTRFVAACASRAAANAAAARAGEKYGVRVHPFLSEAFDGTHA